MVFYQIVRINSIGRQKNCLTNQQTIRTTRQTGGLDKPIRLGLQAKT